MEIKQQYLTMTDGQAIFTTSYIPVAVRGHVHILHGMAEHSGRYKDFAEMLAQQGYYVTTHDHRGHGETAVMDGELGYFAEADGFERIVEDVREVLGRLREGQNLAPTILFGHSMGSFVARRFIQLHSDQVARVIICGTGATTALHLAGNVLAKTLSKWQGPRVQSQLMNDLSFGSFNQQFSSVKTPFDWLCSHEAAVKKYIADPKCGFVPTNQFFADLTQGLLTIGKSSENARIRAYLPVLFISGQQDPVGENGAGVYKVAAAMQSAGVVDVCVYLFEGMRHEVLNEKNKQHVYDVINWWLKQHEKTD